MTDDPYALDHLWLNAFAALGRIKLTTDDGAFDGGAVADPDVGPIVELLRSDTPMPASARLTLAELLAPGEPPLENWKLVPERIKHVDPIGVQMDGVAAFEKNRNAGMTVETAAEQAGIRGSRQIHRYRERLEALGRRLRGDDAPKPR